LAATQGIPYKVYATELTLAGARYIQRYFRLWVVAYALFWLAFYAWYWTR
jgi:hypothetical protein